MRQVHVNAVPKWNQPAIRSASAGPPKSNVNATM